MRFLAGLLAVFASLLPGCQRSEPVTEATFTQRVAQAVSAASPRAGVRIVQDLHIEVTRENGENVTLFLNNAYALAAAEPENAGAVIDRLVRDALAVREAAALQPGRVVPVVKDRDWLTEALPDAKPGEPARFASEPLNDELVIVYAEDSDTKIGYPGWNDLEAVGFARAGARERAYENLRRVLPPVEVHGDDGVWLVTAGGDYEASLLLSPSMWTKEQFPTTGELVAAVPTRDLLLVADAGRPECLEKIKSLAKQYWGKGPYALTPAVFVRREGAWTLYDPNR